MSPSSATIATTLNVGTAATATIGAAVTYPELALLAYLAVSLGLLILFAPRQGLKK